MEKLVTISNPDNKIERRLYSAVYDVYSISNMLLSFKELNNNIHITFLDTEVQTTGVNDPIYKAFNKLFNLLESSSVTVNNTNNRGYYMLEVSDSVYELKDNEDNVHMVLEGIIIKPNTLAVLKGSNIILRTLFGVDINININTTTNKINSLIYHLLDK